MVVPDAARQVRQYYNLEELWATTRQNAASSPDATADSASNERGVKAAGRCGRHPHAGWVVKASTEFAGGACRPRRCHCKLIEVRAEPRTTSKTVEAMMAAEARSASRRRCPQHCRRVILDERGVISPVKARPAPQQWRAGGENVVLVGAPAASRRRSRRAPMNGCACRA